MRSLAGRLIRRLMPPSEKIAGYEHPELVDVVFRKTIAYKPSREWPEIAGATSVLDFGGGCGLHYKEAQSPTIRWAIVETPAMVKRAAELSTERLRFFTEITDAAGWLGDIDVMHCNGALHFSPDPLSTLEKLCALRALKMFWSRMHLGSDRGVQVSHLVDNGPGSAPSDVKNKFVEYAYAKTTEAEFLAAHKGYHLEARGEDWFRFIYL
jgi:putative methyltransferase (TIGR04325 family)